MLLYAQLLKLRIDAILNKPVRIALIFYPLWSGYGFCLFLAAVNFLVSTYFGSSLSEVVSDGLDSDYDLDSAHALFVVLAFIE